MDVVKEKLLFSRGQEYRPELSLLFHWIGKISPTVYERYVRDEVFVKVVDYIIDGSRVSLDILYYLGLYYRSDLYEKDCIDQWVLAQMNSNREIMEKWVEVVKKNKSQLDFSEGSLAYTVEQFLIDSKE